MVLILLPPTGQPPSWPALMAPRARASAHPARPNTKPPEKQSSTVLAICFIGIPVALVAFLLGVGGVAVLMGALPLPLLLFLLQSILNYTVSQSKPLLYVGILPQGRQSVVTHTIISAWPALCHPADEPDRTHWYSNTQFADIWRTLVHKNPFYATSEHV